MGELLLEECPKRCVAHVLLSAFVVVLILLINLREGLAEDDGFARVLLVGVEVNSKEVLDSLVQIQRKCVVRNFMRVSMLNRDDAVCHDVTANFLQMVDRDVLEVEERIETNFFAMVRV